MGKVYLVWEYESYCDYDVIKIFSNEEKAKKFILTSKINSDYYPHYEVEEKEVSTV